MFAEAAAGNRAAVPRDPREAESECDGGSAFALWPLPLVVGWVWCPASGRSRYSFVNSLLFNDLRVIMTDYCFAITPITPPRGVVLIFLPTKIERNDY